MKINRMLSGLFVAIMVVLPGCIYVPKYARKSLNNVSNHCAYRGSEHNVIVQAKRLTVPEVEYLFGFRNEKLSDIFSVMYVSVHNLSNVDYIVLPQEIDTKLVMPKDVVKIMKKTNTVSRFAGVAGTGLAFVGSLFGWCTPLTEHIPFGVLIPFLLSAVVGVPLGITFLVHGIKSIVMNHRIKKDVQQKMIDKKVIIKSGDKYEGLLFVKHSDYKSQFSIKMHEKKAINNSIIFAVDLRNN